MTLFVSLTGLTSYSHLLNLENLDISHNEVESLRREYSPPPNGTVTPSLSLHVENWAVCGISENSRQTATI